MARCTKRRVKNVTLYKSFSQTPAPLFSGIGLLFMWSEQCSVLVCHLHSANQSQGLEGRSRRFREQCAVNNIVEDIVWMEAQNPFYAPIFQNSFNVLTNTSHKYKCKYKYKCSVLGFLLLTYYSGKVISGVHCEQIFEMSRPKLVSSAISHSPVRNMLKIFPIFTFLSHPLYLYLSVFMAAYMSLEPVLQ